MATIEKTSICNNCDEVFQTRETCPVCGSVAITPLAAWVLPLGRVIVSSAPIPGPADQVRSHIAGINAQ